jgi:hypothetical protein
MQTKTFILQLLITTLLTAGLLFALHQVDKVKPYFLFSWISLGIFVVLSAIMYFVGQQAAQSDNKYTFTNTILGFTVGKLFLAIMVILGYDQLAEPSTKFFIFPFFVVYAVFTGFETYVMMKLSKAAKT